MTILDPLRVLAADVAELRWSASVLTAGHQPVVLDHLGADDVLPTASIGKVFLLLAVLDEIDSGRLDPDETVGVTDADLVADSGILQFLDHQTMSVLELCRLVGAVSDNLASNVLIRRLGLARVGEVTDRLGIARCRLHDIVRDERQAHHPAALSTGTASELADLMRRVHIGHAISPTSSQALVELLRLNTDLSMVASAFALDPLAHVDDDLGIRLFNKTGTGTGTCADVGVVERRSGDGGGDGVAVAYAVIASWDDDSFARRASILGAMSEVGGRILGVLSGTAGVG